MLNKLLRLVSFDGSGRLATFHLTEQLNQINTRFAMQGDQLDQFDTNLAIYWETSKQV